MRQICAAGMSFLNSLPSADSIIRRMVVEEKRTLSDVCIALREAFPDISRGLSKRSIRRYCAENGIHSTSRLKDDVIDRLVLTSIQKVC